MDALGQLDATALRRLRKADVRAGLFAVAMFAYVRPSIGGWSESGYARDMVLITVPALLWLMVAYRGRRLNWRTWAMLILFATPLVLLGILTGRRGPTFMIAVGVGMGWFLMRDRRLPLVTVLGAGAALGMILLLLVVF